MHLAYFSEDYSALQEDMFERILQNEENKLRPLCKLVPCESFCEPIEESKCVSPRINKPNRARRDRDTERLAAKCKKNRGVDPANKNRKNGHWDLEENKRYHWFLEIHSSHFIQKHLRRMDKIFKSMALFVATREAEQCRSHHQKMEKKFYTFAEIIKNLRTQHYGSTDTDALIDEIASNAIPFNEALILPLNELRSVQSQQLPPTFASPTANEPVILPSPLQEEEPQQLDQAIDFVEEMMCYEGKDSFINNVLM